MKNYFSLLLFTLMVLWNASSFAQDGSDNNPTQVDYNIPTPTAASFTKFGNVPVNFYTGLPQINVPLYNVPVGKHMLPISLSYHASGIKANDPSSDVGLGWILDAENMISRVVRGKPDEMGYVGNNDSSWIISTPGIATSVPATADTFKLSALNIKDCQPDEFYFNIGEISGKFILTPHTQTFLADQDVIVDCTSGANGFRFTLTDAKGVKYYFNDVSVSSNTGCGDDPGTLDFISSWHISKIIYPDTRDSLVFTYTTENISLSHHSESKIYDYYLGGGFPVKNRNCESYSNVLEKKLSSIIAPTATVNFSYTQPKLEVANSNALTQIEILDNNNTSYLKVKFAYSYYDNIYYSPTIPKRLKLDSVWLLGTDASVTSKYKFGYNGNACIPFQGKAQDIWGYYNGANSNSSLIPGNTYQLTDNTGMTFMVPGGNREIDTAYCSKGVLNKIIYPAGGFTMFDYEPNNYGRANGTYIADTVYANSAANVYASCVAATSNPLLQRDSVQFLVNFTQVTQITTNGTQFNCTGDTRQVVLRDLTTSQIIASSQGNAIPDITLVAGHTYRLTAIADCSLAEQNMLTCNEYVSANIAYKTITSTVSKNRFTGGLRIKKITDFDPYSSISNVKKYSYQIPNEPDRTSGVLMFQPIFNYMVNYIFDQNMQGGSGGPGGGYIPDFIEVVSNVFDSEVDNTAQSNNCIVGYQYVKETIGDNGEGGSRLYTYSVDDDSLYLETYPYVPFTTARHRDGNLIEIKDFDAGSTLVRKVTNHYAYIPNKSIPGWKAAYRRYHTPTLGNPLTPDVFFASSYKYISEKIRLDSTTEIQYSGGNVLTNSSWSEYIDNGSYCPYKTCAVNSDGKITNIFSYRASDFSVVPTSGLSGMPAALSYMNQNHLNDYPIENFSVTNGQVTGGVITEYLINDLGTSKKVLPSAIFRLDIAAPISNYFSSSHQVTNSTGPLGKDTRYSTETTYLSYNDKGNPTALTGPGNESVALVWGYKNLFPVLKARNLDPTSLYTYLNANPSVLSILNNPTGDNTLRNVLQQIRSNFPFAIVTGYTYNPLLGITSETDVNNKTTYYEYDPAGRLKIEMDNMGNVVKRYTYQFQGSN